jgi:hypothetical protein
MSVQQGRPSRFWAAIVAVALLLLGIILVVVVLLSSHLRQGERETVVRLVPMRTAPPAATTSHTERRPTRPSATSNRTQRSDAKLDRIRAEPPRIVQRPVKVIEKQVKVVEKQVKVIERPVKVIQKPVKVTQQPTRATVRPAEQADRAVPTTGSTDLGPAASSFQETGLPNQITYAGKVWNASEVVNDVSPDVLAADSRKVDGRTIYHDQDADVPYPRVYIQVAGETEQYVRYVPTTS